MAEIAVKGKVQIEPFAYSSSLRGLLGTTNDLFVMGNPLSETESQTPGAQTLHVGASSRNNPAAFKSDHKAVGISAAAACKLLVISFAL